MKPKRIRIGIVGVGRWARAAHLPALASLERAELAAVASRHYDSALRTAKEFRIRKTYRDWRSLVRSADLDAVVVLSPPRTHYPVVMEALRREKHVLCEGPLGMNREQGEEMLALAEKKGLVHAYTRPKLYVDGCGTVRRLLEDGSIGRAHDAQLTWRPKVWLDGNTPLGWRHRLSESPPLLAVVPIIMIIDLLGPVRSVCADFGVRIGRRKNEATQRWSRVTAPDYCQLLLRMKNGALVSIQAGADRKGLDESGLWISGSEGSLRWLWSMPNRVRVSRGAEGVAREVPYAFDFRREWTFDRDFVNAILTSSLPAYNFRRGAYEMQVIDAASASARTGRRVCL